MSTESPSQADNSQYEQYRAISIAAVVALVFGLMSLFALLGVIWDASSAILTIPVVGTIVGWLAIRKLKRQSGELTGMPVAIVGAVVSVICLVCGGLTRSIDTALKFRRLRTHFILAVGARAQSTRVACFTRCT